MDLDLKTILLLLFLLLAPAIVVFSIMTVLRVRRSKFQRQRITKGNRKPPE